ncbi:hypothetical protein T310_8627, partial [Rasamsonia emersonii CBS 393.64]
SLVCSALQKFREKPYSRQLRIGSIATVLTGLRDSSFLKGEVARRKRDPNAAARLHYVGFHCPAGPARLEPRGMDGDTVLVWAALHPLECWTT